MTTQEILQGVHDWTNGKIVYDISVAHPDGQGKPTPYADLTAALGAGGANIPKGLRKGGMSVKFIQGTAQSSDNKYMRFNLLADEFTTDVTEWAVDDDGVYGINTEYLEVKLDSKKRILWGIKKDGGIFYGAGVPQQVKDYIQQKIEELSLDEYEDIVTFLGSLIENDKTLAELLAEKVDKEEGEGLTPLQYIQEVDDNKYIYLLLDSKKRILEAITKEEKIINLPIKSPTITDFKERIEELEKGGGTDIISLNSSAKTILPQMAYRYNYHVTSYVPLLISFITDIHGKTENLKRYMDFNSKYSSYIDVMFHGGDTVQQAFNISEVIIEDAGAENMLNSIGNHDTMYYDSQEGTSDGNYYKETTERRVQLYNALIGNYVSRWNVTQPANAATDGLCYYYKDFSSKKIRMIVLDCMEKDTYMENQMTWLSSVLNELLDSNAACYGYSAVICQHYIPCSSAAFTKIECPFTSVVTPSGFSANTTLQSIVDTFIENGGNFVFYLVGHVHRDYCGYITVNNHKQLIVSTATGAGNNGSAKDFNYVENGKSQDCFNIFGIDTTFNLLKIYRVGADMDMSIRKKETISIDYINCTIK